MLNIALKIEKKGDKPLYIQLYEQIKEGIIHGSILPETKFPSIRQLAKELDLSKTTIEAAYQQLTAEGYITSLPNIGYFASNLEHSSYIIPQNKKELKKQTIPITPRENKKIIYDFCSNSLDQDSFDFALWRRYTNKVLKNEQRLLVYGYYQGEPELRQEIVKYLRGSRGVICDSQQVVVGAGVQSLLHLLAGLLTPAYGPIGFEEPGFRQGRYVFRDHGFTIIPLQMDEEGIKIEQLHQQKIKAVYVSPSHQFPMGTAMPITRRSQLLNWAHEQGGLIIEDDYDSELRYLGRPLPSLQGLNQGKSVVYLGTFSKTMLPSLRISYMVLPPELLDAYQKQGKQYNQTSSQIEQLTLANYLKDGCLERQTRRLRKLYARKNQILVEAIREIMKDKVRILGQESGLHILLEVQSSVSSEELAKLAEEAGVKVQPISSYFMDDHKAKQKGSPSSVLLAYGGIAAEKIVPAVQSLWNSWASLF